jgi:hypothetical protein
VSDLPAELVSFIDFLIDETAGEVPSLGTELVAEAVLSLASVAARDVVRPAAPVAEFAAGYLAASRGPDTGTTAFETIRDLVRRWRETVYNTETE